MGIPAIVGIVVAIVVSVASTAFAILSARGATPEQSAGLDPASIDDVQATLANESIVVPLVYGRVRVRGNVIWYGNLIYEQTFLIADVVTQTGFRYFLDVWEAICLGECSLIAVYVNNKKVEDLGVQEPIWTFLQHKFNNGFETTKKPDQFFGDGPQPPEFVNSIPGVCWSYHNSYLLGEQTTVLQNRNYVVERTLKTPVNFQNMANGSNPSAVIYDLLRKAKVPASKIDLDSFNVASTFWNDKGYGINLAIQQITDIESSTKPLLDTLDASMSENRLGKIVLKVRDKNATSEATLVDDDYLDFKCKRVTYEQTKNIFKATFIDEDQDYTSREIGDDNQANIFLSGRSSLEPLNLNIFRDRVSASKRLSEIKKDLSYPALEIEVTTHLGFSDLLPGSKITIQNSNLGLTSVTFWVTEISKKGIDKNEFTFKARQATETLFTDVFQIGGGSFNPGPQDYSLEEFLNVRILELPYTSQFGFEPAFAYLVNREKGIESNFLIQVSETIGSGYSDMAVSNIFSASGNLAEAYNQTQTIDEENGILYTPDFRDPVFENITQNQLYNSKRFAVIGNEILYFRDVSNEGNDIRLSGVVRARFWTPNENHSIGEKIYLFYFGNNVQQGISFKDFYSKAIAQFNAEQFDPSLVTPILTSRTNRAKKPIKPSFAKATRSGSDIDVEIFPVTPDLENGFGDGGWGDGVWPSPAVHPIDFIGELVVKYDSTTITLTASTTTNFSRAGAFALTIEHKRFNILSDSYIINVGSTDGEYL